jgi:hypothetical protein
VPKTYDGSILVIRAMEVSPELKAEASEVYDDSTFGWQSVSTQPVTVDYVRGVHLRLMSQPYIQAVGTSLQHRINQNQLDRFVTLY